MSAHKKRKVARAEESSSSEDESTGTSQSDSDGSSHASDSESEKGSDVAVDLEFFDPKESDFQGLKSLLHLFLDGREYDSSELADTIIKQVRLWRPNNPDWQGQCQLNKSTRSATTMKAKAICVKPAGNRWVSRQDRG